LGVIIAEAGLVFGGQGFECFVLVVDGLGEWPGGLTAGFGRLVGELGGFGPLGGGFGGFGGVGTLQVVAVWVMLLSL
jgi:hypothetical protein